MAFREGQRVRIRNDLDKRNGTREYRYYYGGSSDEIPLNSEGEITSISPEGKYIWMSINGKTWEVHPNEIRALSGENNPLIVNREFKHPVFSMSYQDHVLVLDGKMYLAGSEQKAKTGNFYESSGIFRKKRKAIVGGIELSELDELFIDRNKNKLRALGDNYVNDELDLFSDERITSDVDTPLLIVKNVFPYLRKDKQKSKIIGLLGIEKKQDLETEKIEDSGSISDLEIITESIYQRAQAEIRAIESENGLSGRIAKLLSEGKTNGLGDFIKTGLFISNGEARKVKHSGLGWMFFENININGNRYTWEDSHEVEGIENSYLNKLWRETRIDAIRRNFTKEKIRESISAKAKGLEFFLGRTAYNEGEIGFTRMNGQYYVCLDVPAFALKSQFDGKYYAFDATRVGIRVRNVDGKLRFCSDERPAIMENNNHPLTTGGTGIASICYGNNSVTNEGMNDGETIANRLRQAREIVLYGYYGKGHFYASLSSNERFRGNLRSYDEVKRSGMLIIDGDRT